MLNNYEMSSVCVDTGVMWRLSEDFNRRFAARVHQQSHHVHSHHAHSLHHHHHHHRPASMAMIYNGIFIMNKLLVICFVRCSCFSYFVTSDHLNYFDNEEKRAI